MPCGYLVQRGGLGRAPGLRELAAGGEPAARRRVDGARDLAPYDPVPGAARGQVRDGDGREQGSRVGMPGLGEEFLRARQFHALAEVEDRYVV